MGMDTKKYAALLSPMITKWFDGSYNNVKAYPSVIEQIYNVESSSNATEVHAGWAPFGMFTEQDGDGGTFDYDEITLGRETTYIHKKYAKGFYITEAMYRFDKSGVIKKLSSALGRSAKWTYNYAASLPLSLGFGSATAGQSAGSATFGNTTQSFRYADGLSLFSASHPLLVTGQKVNDLYSLATTWDNLVSGALTEANLASAFTKLQKQPNELGIIDGLRLPQVLIVHPDNYGNAMQLKKNTATNGSTSANPYSSGVVPATSAWDWEIVVDPYLLDSSDWFVRSSLDMTEGFFYWVEKPTAPKTETDFDTDNIKTKSRMWFSNGFDGARGWVGGTTS